MFVECFSHPVREIIEWQTIYIESDFKENVDKFPFYNREYDVSVEVYWDWK